MFQLFYGHSDQRQQLVEARGTPQNTLLGQAYTACIGSIELGVPKGWNTTQNGKISVQFCMINYIINKEAKEDKSLTDTLQTGIEWPSALPFRGVNLAQFVLLVWPPIIAAAYFLLLYNSAMLFNISYAVAVIICKRNHCKSTPAPNPSVQKQKTPCSTPNSSKIIACFSQHFGEVPTTPCPTHCSCLSPPHAMLPPWNLYNFSQLYHPPCRQKIMRKLHYKKNDGLIKPVFHSPSLPNPKKQVLMIIFQKNAWNSQTPSFSQKPNVNSIRKIHNHQCQFQDVFSLIPTQFCTVTLISLFQNRLAFWVTLGKRVAAFAAKNADRCMGQRAYCKWRKTEGRSGISGKGDGNKRWMYIR